MRLIAIGGLISIAAVLACAGCGGTQYAPSSNDLAATEYGFSQPSPAPLKLCAAPAPPKDLATKPGFTMLNVNVANAAHQPINGLRQSDFAAYSKAIAYPVGYLKATTYPIAYFHTNNGAAPESIALVIDTSGSMQPKLPAVRKALGDFLAKLYPCDEVAVFAFSDRSYRLLAFTTDHQAAIQRLSILQTNGETALYDSIAQAIDYAQSSADYPNRTIVVITDGMDNQSKMTESDLVAKSKMSGVRMFLIGIGDPNVPVHETSIAIGSLVINGGAIERVDAKAINEFANATGGEAFIVPKVEDKDDSGAFAKALASIGAALGQGYSLGIVLPPGISASSVTVAIPTRPDAVVTTRVVPPTKSSGS